MEEPILTDEDRRIWRKWKRLCLLHAKTNVFRRRTDRSMAAIHDMVVSNPDAYIAWSAGKDSTAMTHLIRVVCGHDLVAMSIKDDGDFPEEIEYIEGLARKWGLRLDIVQPEVSVQDAYSKGLAGDDIHSRACALSDQVFYSLINQYRESRGCPGVFLGLRAAESKARAGNASRGFKYTKKNGETVCQPIVRWSDRDVFAYLFMHDIEPLPLYRCVRLAESPGQIRKSWWLPGKSARYGQAIWLRTYYPSLYAKAKQLLPGLSQFA